MIDEKRQMVLEEFLGISHIFQDAGVEYLYEVCMEEAPYSIDITFQATSFEMCSIQQKCEEMVSSRVEIHTLSEGEQHDLSNIEYPYRMLITYDE